MSPSPRSKRRAALILLFMGGVALGLGIALFVMQRRLDSILARGDKPSRAWIISTLTDKVALSKEQQEAVGRAYDTTDVDRQLDRIAVRPIVNRAAYRFIEEVEKALTPEQREKLSRIVDDSISVNRTPCLANLTLRLHLSVDHRRTFDEILARVAQDPKVRRDTVRAACSSLFEVAADEIAAKLPAEKVEVYKKYLEELRSESTQSQE